MKEVGVDEDRQGSVNSTHSSSTDETSSLNNGGKTGYAVDA